MRLTVTTDPLMRPLVLHYANGAGIHAEGICIATTDKPQVCVETAEGKHIWWHAELAKADGETLTSAQLQAFRERQPNVATIDPDSREHIGRLASLLVSENATLDDRGVGHAGLRRALREFANPTPPKMQEPSGVGAVIETERGEKWVRCGPNEWRVSDGSAFPVKWSSLVIDVVRVLSEGVPA